MKRELFGNKKTTTLAVLASLAIGIAATGTASAGPCKLHRHVGYGNIYPLRSQAVRHAIAIWKIRVRDHDGHHFMLWEWAQSKSLRVYKTGSRWRAVAGGRPCMGPSSLQLKQ